MGHRCRAGLAGTHERRRYISPYQVRSRWRADGGRIDPKAAGPAYALPSALLDDLSWKDVLNALDHEEGRGARGGEAVATADERLRPKPGKGGIFVIDQYGTISTVRRCAAAHP